MDPNEALARIRDGVRKYDSLDESDTSMAIIVAEEVIEHFQALDGWLSRGGFLPDVWRSEELRSAERAYDLVHPGED